MWRLRPNARPFSFTSSHDEGPHSPEKMKGASATAEDGLSIAAKQRQAFGEYTHRLPTHLAMISAKRRY